MADELDLDLDLDFNEDQGTINRTNKRIKALSEKFELSEKEKAELAQAKEAEIQARATAEKERDFYKGFNAISSKYQGASEYQDQIWEKVKGGYDMEDATVAILNKEGKLQPQQVPQREQVAGGSASTMMPSNDSKTPDEMSQDERRSALADAFAKGEITL